MSFDVVVPTVGRESLVRLLDALASGSAAVPGRVLVVDDRRDRGRPLFSGVPVVVNTSLNTAGRPMVDDPRDALECFGSAPVDVLALGPFLVRRRAFTGP